MKFPTYDSTGYRGRPEGGSLWVLTLLLAAPLFSESLAFAQDERVFLCRKTEDAIRIDGKADEPAWRTAEEISPFLAPWVEGGDKEAASRTSARLLWDDTYLYFFAEMEDADLLAETRQQDGETWKDDVFELFFKPDDGNPGYYEFEINALGTKLDMFIPERHPDLYERHKSDRRFSIAAKVVREGTLNRPDDRDKGWRCEGRIPWTDFEPTGGGPKLNAQWRFNLCRYDYSNHLPKSPELSVCGPNMPKDFHAWESFAPIRFVEVWDPRTALPEKLQDIRGFGGSRIVGTPEPPLPFVIEPAYEEHRVSRLIAFKFEPGSGRMLYVDQPPGAKDSRLMRYDPKTGEEVELLHPPHVIYDFEFHPDWKENRQLLVSLWGPAEADRFERIVRVRRFEYDPATGDPLDPDAAETVIEWPSRGHTGGALAFDDEGLFYVTTGDGTSDSDNNLTGQNLEVLHAKVLRIDIDRPEAGRAYGIPKDNPFLGRENTRPETFAYGLRNPWRSDWDSRLKRLWVGNNGQDRLEQVYLIEAGGNYGWSVYEGSRVFYAERERGPDPILEPTAEHDHGESRSLTGGVVYTGDKYPDLKDCFLYGDHTTGKIWAVLHDGEEVVKNWEIADTMLRITEFGVDPATGDILVASHENVPSGGLYKLVPNPRKGEKSRFPRKLSQTGLFRSVKGHEVAAELLPYDVVVPEWADGAKIERHLALPKDDPHIGFAPRRGWNFPDGTVAMQSFAFGEGEDRRLVETRILTKAENEWAAYSYAWNDSQTDAELVGVKGAEIDLGDRKWKVPSRTECMVCHSRAANFVLGLKTAQMNRDRDYGGGYSANQLTVVDDLGFFLRKGAKKRTSLLRQPPDELERFADPFDPGGDINDRARSYLHATCAHCHVESGGGNARMSLTRFADDETFNVFNAAPNHGDQGLGRDAKIIATGDPARSVLIHRCVKTGPGRMPPFGSSTPDSRAVGLLMQWVVSLEDYEAPEPEPEPEPAKEKAPGKSPSK